MLFTLFCVRFAAAMKPAPEPPTQISNIPFIAMSVALGIGLLVGLFVFLMVFERRASQRYTKDNDPYQDINSRTLQNENDVYRATSKYNPKESPSTDISCHINNFTQKHTESPTLPSKSTPVATNVEGKKQNMIRVDASFEVSTHPAESVYEKGKANVAENHFHHI